MLTRAQRRCHIVVVFGLYVLFFLPLWIVLPSLSEYIIARRCLAMYGIFNSTGPICGQADVSASGQQWNTWVMLACNIPSVLVVLPLGRLMDVYGRRPAIIWCLATQLVGSAGMLSVCFFELDLVWFMPPYVINGLGGGSYALQSIMMASLTDVATSKQHRNFLLAVSTASYYACGCVGPLVGGYISSTVGSSALEFFPALGGKQYQFAYFLFFASNALLLLVAILSWGETLPIALRRKDMRKEGIEVPRQASCGVSFRNSFVGAFNTINSRAIGITSIVIMVLYSTINVALNGVIISYAKLETFHMDDETVGWFLAIPWGIRAVATSIIFPLLLRCIIRSRCFQQRNQKEASCFSTCCQPKSAPLHNELLEPPSSSYTVDSGAKSEVAGGYHTCVISLWLLRAGAIISTSVFSCFGLATSTPLLFLLCGLEGFAAIWDAASTVLLSTLVERYSAKKRARLVCPSDDGVEVDAAQARAILLENGPSAASLGADSCDETRLRAHSDESIDYAMDANEACTVSSNEESDQGSALGLRALLQTSMACVGPFIFTEIYASTVHWNQAFLFYTLAGFCALGLGLSFFVRNKDI